MNKERDKFFIEVLKLNPKIYWNFSTWQGFGKLLEWFISKTQDGEQYDEWAELFLFSLQVKVMSLGCKMPILPTKYIHPDRFADALYQFLKEKTL